MPYKSERLMCASDCEDPEFAADNMNAVRDYAKERALGYHCGWAFQRVFGCQYSDQEAYKCAMGFERNPVYVREFDRAIETLPLEKLWNPRIAAHQLLSVLRHPATKQSVKITAIRELDVLFDITTIDEFGRTQGSKKLADFYATEAAKAKTAEDKAKTAEERDKTRQLEPEKSLPRHPEPGTPEAIALEASANT